jgi:DEAD/DEAH box helicase domain-containing protein
MGASQVVLDLETKKSFQEIGSKNPAELEITVVGVYFTATQEYRTFEESEIPELEQHLSNASRIIGFNIRRFDFPALQPYLKRLKLSEVPYLDILEEIEKTLGHRVSLQTVAKATLNEGKSGSGLDAIEYYRNGEMEKLKKYCLDDVRITYNIYEYVKKFGHLYYFSKDGSNRLEAKINWKDPDPPANLTLF